MIDQSLRDALISHWDENCNGVDWLAGTPEEYASEAIRFLAAHPAEPAVDGHNGLDCRPTRSVGETMRAALEAAAPLLGPRPLLDPEALGNTGGSGRSNCPGCGREVLVNGDGGRRRHNRWQDEPCNGLPGQGLAARPLLDREAVRRVINEARLLPVTHSNRPSVEAVMELARPMPTQEQIEATVRKTIFAHFGTFTGAVTAIVDDVEALLNGAES